MSDLETRLVRVKKVVMMEIGGELIKDRSLRAVERREETQHLVSCSRHKGWK